MLRGLNIRMTEKMKVGRHTDYHETFDDDLEADLAQGYSFTASCGRLGICTTTGYVWLKKHPSFADAYKRGKALGQAHWEKLALDHVVEGKDGDKTRLNPAVWIFTMKAKYGWSDQPEEIVDDEEFPEPGEE